MSATKLRVLRVIAIVVTLLGSSAAAAPRAKVKAKAGPRATSLPTGDGWWCWTATDPRGAVTSGCVRDQPECIATAQDVALRPAIQSIGRCTLQANAAVLTYFHRLEDRYAVAAFASFVHCKHHRAFLGRALRDDVTKVSSCGLIGRVAAPDAPPLADPPREQLRVERPPPSPPSPLPDSLTKDDIVTAMAAVRTRVEACGRSSVQGTVKAAVVVSSAGSIASIAIKETPDDDLGTCVATALRQLTFPRTQNGGSFSYPFRF